MFENQASLYYYHFCHFLQILTKQIVYLSLFHKLAGFISEIPFILMGVSSLLCSVE